VANPSPALAMLLRDDFVQVYGSELPARPFPGACSLYLLPSYREGTPRTALEAHAQVGHHDGRTRLPGDRGPWVEWVSRTTEG
jgi:hypothetical protein